LHEGAIGLAPDHQLGVPAGARSFASLNLALVPGTALPKPEGVFPRHVEAEAGEA